jgi:putative toxin-antitoxin system antitoxin component (TIGR02293 family)
MQSPRSPIALFPAYTLKNSFDLVKKASLGIEAEAFFETVSVTGFTKEALASLLDTSVKTLQRQRKANNRLTTLRSEHLLKLMALYEHGQEVFGSVEEFKKWLSKPAFGLGNYLPMELLKTFSGIDLIEEELTRIDYGDLA